MWINESYNIIHLHFMLAICMLSHSIYNYVVYIIRLYVWHVNCCYGISHCLYSGLVKLIVTVQAHQHKKTGYIVLPIQ